MVYDNVITDSDIGIRATRSHSNLVQNTTFSNIESSEFRLLADSSLTIREQQFDDALITESDSQTIGSTLEIAGSGIIRVTEDGGGDDEDDEDEESDNDGGEGEDRDSFNTDVQPYRRTLSDGDSITVTSSAEISPESSAESPLI